MAIDFTKRNWLNGPSGGTPIDAVNLNRLESAIEALAAGALSQEDADATYVRFEQLAKNPDSLIQGTITRDSAGVVTSAQVVWPDGTPGTYITDTISTAFPGTVDAYHITYGSPVTKTYTQPAVTRNATGAPTAVPAIVVS